MPSEEGEAIEPVDDPVVEEGQADLPGISETHGRGEGDASWSVAVTPQRNTTQAAITVEALDAILASGEAGAIVVDAAMSYRGTITLSVSETVALTDIDAATAAFAMDFENFGRFTVTVRFTLGRATVAGSTSFQTVGIVADEYNLAPLTATMPVTMFSLSLWGESNIRTAGPTIALLMRAGAWDWNSLPGPRDGMYGVYALPYLTEEAIAYQSADYSEESAVFRSNFAAFDAYVEDLHALDPSSRFNLYLGDNFVWIIQEALYANRIPADRYAIFANANSGLALDVNGEQTANGTNVNLWAPNGGRNQRFLLIPVPPQVDVAGMARLPEGLYALTPAVNTAERLDISGESTEAGGNAIVWTATGMDNQAFEISQADDGFYVIACALSGKVLDIPSASLIAGANVVQSERIDGQLTQEWAIYSRVGGSYVLKNVGTGLTLEVAGGSAAAGANVQGGSEDGSAAQRWSIARTTTARAALDALARQNKNSVLTGSYVIQTVMKDGQVVGIAGASSAANANVELNRYASRASQTWEIAYDDDGYATLTNAGSGLVLAIRGGSHQSGANIICWTAHGGANQQWRFTRLDDGFYRIESVLSGKLLDVSGSTIIPGTNVLQWTVNGGLNQEWAVYRAGDGSYTLRNVGTGLMLDLYGSSTENGANVDAYRENGAASQRWTLTEAAG